MRVKLQHVAHARSGDKGNTSNIAVFAYDAGAYPFLKEQLTAERLKAFYQGVDHRRGAALQVDGLHAINFVAHGALGGGVSRSLCLDNYGKALSARDPRLRARDSRRAARPPARHGLRTSSMSTASVRSCCSRRRRCCSPPARRSRSTPRSRCGSSFRTRRAARPTCWRGSSRSGLTDKLGQTFIVENRPARAAPSARRRWRSRRPTATRW